MSARQSRMIVLGIVMLLAAAAVWFVLRDGGGRDRLAEVDVSLLRDDRALPPLGRLSPDLDREPIAPVEPPVPLPGEEDLAFPPFPELAGLGWRIHGRVTDRSGRPLPGARVAVVIDRNEPSLYYDGGGTVSGPLSCALAAPPVFTDEAGLYAVSIAEPPWIEAARQRWWRLPYSDPFDLCVCARKAGHEPECEWLSHGDNWNPVRADIALAQGGNLHACIVLPDGSPACGADLFARREDASWSRIAGPNFDGSVVGRAPDGVPIEVVAMNPNLGASAAWTLVPGATGAEPWPVLVLQPFGTIAGVVVDPTGAPIPDAVFEAYPIGLVNASEEELDEFQNQASQPGEDDLLPDAAGLRGRGRPHAGTVTDGDGRFRFGGLRDGRYFVQAARGGHWWFDADVILPRIPCSTGDLEVRVEIALHFLLLRVLDEDGRPIARGLATVRRTRNGETMHGGCTIENGRASEAVTPGPIELEAFGPDGLHGRRDIVYPSEVFRHEIELRLAKRAPGAVVLMLTAPDGFRCESEPAGAAAWRRPPQVWVLGQHEDAYRPAEPEPDGTSPDWFRVAVPAGWTRVVVRPGGPDADFVSIEGRVQVEPGACQPMLVPVHRGGKIRAVSAPDREPRPRLGIDCLQFVAASGETQKHWLVRKRHDSLLEQAADRFSPRCPWSEIFEPGEYQLSFAENARSVATLRFAVDAGKVTEIAEP